MSILQKIIENMYVEPELLAELDDEQKQILFCKMREEQVRRYADYEKTLEAKNATLASNNVKSRRNIQWLLGADGNPWVWVMGEHAQDKSIEEILDVETQEKARRLAEEEAEMLRIKEEEELKEKLRQEQLEIEQERELQEMLRNSGGDCSERNSFDMLNSNDNVREKHGSKNNSEVETIILRQKSVDTRLKNGDDSSRLVNEHTSKRASEIYQSLIEAREKAQSEALNAAEEEKRYWEMQEKKYREAEEQIRILAKKAREQHKIYTLKTTSALVNKFRAPENNGRPAQNGISTNGLDKNVCSRLKPESRQAVVKWFVSEELPRGTGRHLSTNRLASWFHGIIGRDEAERLLYNKPVGSYLVRVSERFFGYALSYKSCPNSNNIHNGNSDSPSRLFKHFLIERIGNGYRFFGSDQIVHDTLWDLINYHQAAPITIGGNEILKESVGQSSFPPNYQELLNGSGV